MKIGKVMSDCKLVQVGLKDVLDLAIGREQKRRHSRKAKL